MRVKQGGEGRRGREAGNGGGYTRRVHKAGKECVPWARRRRETRRRSHRAGAGLPRAEGGAARRMRIGGGRAGVGAARGESEATQPHAMLGHAAERRLSACSRLQSSALPSSALPSSALQSRERMRGSGGAGGGRAMVGTRSGPNHCESSRPPQPPTTPALTGEGAEPLDGELKKKTR